MSQHKLITNNLNYSDLLDEKPINFNSMFDDWHVALIAGVTLPTAIGMTIYHKTPIFLILSLGLILLTLYTKALKAASQQLLKFSKSNNFELWKNVNPHLLLQHSILQYIGYDPKIHFVIRNQFLDFPFELFHYSYKPDKSSRNNRKNFLVVKTPIARKLPHILLDSKKSGFIKNSVLPVRFGEHYKLELEGDFNKHYNLYSSQNLQVDTLSILTPDVMAWLIDLEDKLDIEIVDYQIYFYYSTNSFSRNKIKMLLNTCEAFALSIKRNQPIPMSDFKDIHVHTQIHKMKSLSFAPDNLWPLIVLMIFGAMLFIIYVLMPLLDNDSFF